MESDRRYVWFIAEGKGYVIKEKPNLPKIHQFEPGYYESSWSPVFFKECNNPEIEFELIKLRIKGIINGNHK